MSEKQETYGKYTSSKSPHNSEGALLASDMVWMRRMVREEVVTCLQPLVDGINALLLRVTATFTTSYNQPLPDHALDHLMAAIAEPLDETSEMAAVLATLNQDEWNALVQKVHESKIIGN